MNRSTVAAIEGEYRRYKALADGAIAQLSDAQLSERPGETSNSIATICWHVSGNLASRFTDFLTTDGEKSWRAREEEFAQRSVSRDELITKWENGWSVLFRALEPLTDADLDREVTIRRQPLTVLEALLRSVTHASHHAGQIVYVAKMLKGGKWAYLSIAPGGSDAYNRNPTIEKPEQFVRRMSGEHRSQ